MYCVKEHMLLANPLAVKQHSFQTNGHIIVESIRDITRTVKPYFSTNIRRAVGDLNKKSYICHYECDGSALIRETSMNRTRRLHPSYFPKSSSGPATGSSFHRSHRTMSPKECLFALIRGGLGLPDTFSFPDLGETEWLAIHQLARQQRVEALCFEGISDLPPPKRPPMPLWLQWGGHAIQTERQVHRLNTVLAVICSWLEDENIGFILLKGPAAANRYPNPLRRQCGDIDLLILDNYFDRACRLLERRGVSKIDEAPEKHTAFLWQGIVIELHHTLIDCNSPGAVRYIKQMDFHSISTTILIEGKSYPVLKPTFDGAYMMAHLLHHIWTDGLRLRQICDWMMLLHRHGQEFDNEAFATYLRQMKLERMFPVLLCIGIKHFGLPAYEWGTDISASDERLAEKLLQYIFQPKQHAVHDKPHKPCSGFLKHWKNMVSYITHLWRFRQLSPKEAVWFLPTRIQRFLYKRLLSSEKKNYRQF